MKVISLFVILSSVWLTSFRAEFYTALKSENLEEVEVVLAELNQQEESSINTGYKGTLLMKRAQLLGSPGKKLDSFKEGHVLLEEAIKEEPNNGELRFLRLSIQEHAPGILNYNDKIEEDKAMVIQQYSEFNKELKAYIQDYTKTSKVLSIKELKD